MAFIALGVVVRAVWVLAHPPLEHVYSDMAGYVERAQQLAAGMPLDRYDAFYPPGTHLLLAAPMSVLGTGEPGLWGSAALWFALSAATPFFAWRLARILLTPAAAALTAALTSLWVLHIVYAGYFLSEAPALAFLLAALWLGYRAALTSGNAAVKLGLAAGLLGGVAIGNRPQLILNLLVLAVPLALRGRRHVAMLASLIVGVSVVVGAVVAHNTVAAGKPTGISENTGVTFFIGHCDVQLVQTRRDGASLDFGPPPAFQLDRGRRYLFTDHLAWEQGFFFQRAFDCIEDDGLSHLRRVGRDLLDMTATTIPWPASNERGLRSVVDVVNTVYSFALVPIVGAAVLLARRRRRTGGGSGETVMLAHLACVLFTTVVFFGDPRFRLPYDVFGLALLAALAADSFFDRPSERGGHTAPVAEDRPGRV